MRKKVFIGLVFILLFPCFVWAGDIDGIWWNPDMGPGSIFMIRENGGLVIAVELGLSRFGESYDYCVLIGTQSGENIGFTSSYFCPNYISAIMMLTSPDTGMVHIEQCTPTAAQCLFDTGDVFDIEKAF